MDKYITSVEEYRDLLSQFMSSVGTEIEHLHSESVKGTILPPGAASVVTDLQTWEVREDDVWILAYPKAGTMWTTEIVSAVMHDGDLEAIKKRHIVFRVPRLEYSLPEPLRRLKNLPEMHRVAEEIPSPRVLRSHLPGQLLPPQLWEKKPKIIYVMRNPKDVVVSLFYFSKLFFPIQQILDQSFGDLFDYALSEKVIYGSWWDHYLYFWKRRHEKNILILIYEDMKRDLRGNVEKISTFLGKNFSDEKLDAITEHCTFANMKNNPMSQHDAIYYKQKLHKDMSFMRKGKVGDWKSHFTVTQNEVMDALITEKLAGSGLTFDYE